VKNSNIREFKDHSDVTDRNGFFIANVHHVLPLVRLEYDIGADDLPLMMNYNRLIVNDISILNYLHLDQEERSHLYMVHKKTFTSYLGQGQDSSPDIIELVPFSIEYLGMGEYNGFTLDGNGRFLLGDGIVSHNTNLAQSIANAISLPFTKINMGGSTDVSYFMGHGYTYTGSSPGIIVKTLANMGCKNGFIYLDEFDKMSSFNDKVSHTFLHISDPIQQQDFQDQYMPEIKIDLSNITFIYSFNDKNNINPILLNRIPIIEMPGYSFADKMIIAKDYLIPKIMANFQMQGVSFAQDAIIKLINMSEPSDRHGIRTLKQYISDVISKINVLLLTEGKLNVSYAFQIELPFVILSKHIDKLQIKYQEPGYKDMYM
jgi:hypothetical protein